MDALMSSKRQDIERLQRLKSITDAGHQAAQAKLAEKARAEARIQGELNALDAARTEVLNAMSLSGDCAPAQITCHGVWLVWAERQRAGLNMALAAARARAAQEKDAARLTFGRDQVAQKLLAMRQAKK